MTIHLKKLNKKLSTKLATFFVDECNEQDIFRIHRIKLKIDLQKHSNKSINTLALQTFLIFRIIIQ